MARNPTPTTAQDSPASDESARLQQQIVDLRADVARLLQGIADLGHAKGESMVNAVTGAVRAKADSAAAQADEKLTEARAFVHANPLQALGFAALAGLIFGLFFGRR